MRRKKLVILLVSVFILGVLFAGGSYFTFKKSQAFIEKVKQKLKERKIANIPKTREPLVICDFEKAADLAKWDLASAQVQFSDKYAASGRGSLKMSFQPSPDASAVKIEKYFEKDKSLSDWSRYEVLSFDVYNPDDNNERLILQIKDKNGNKVKINLELESNSPNHVEIDIAQLWDSIKPTNIAQFTLFLWQNQTNKVFYLDNLMLLPAAAFSKANKNILSNEFLPKAGEKIYATGDYFAFNSANWRKYDSQNNPFIEFPVLLNNLLPVALNDFPLSGGISFPKGQLKVLGNMDLVDKDGQALPYQAKVLSYWSDKSIKWILLNTRGNLLPKEEKIYLLRYGDNIKKIEPKSTLTVEETSSQVTVNTGCLKFNLTRDGFYLFDRIWLDKNDDGRFEENELVSSKSDLVLESRGIKYHSCLDKNYTLSVEEKGPLKACLKAEGWFVSEKGEKFCRFVTRITAFSGKSFLKVQHTFIYTGYPENKLHYLYKGKFLPKNETIDAIYIKTPLILERPKLTFAADGQVMQADLNVDYLLLQNKANKYEIAKDDVVINSGKELAGWIDLSTASEGLSIGVKNFWEQFPKGFSIDDKNKCIITYLWPNQAGELDLKTTESAYGPDAVARGSAFGLAKTHEIGFYFHKGDYQSSAAKEVISGLCTDIVLVVRPKWFSQSKVLGRLWPYDKRLGQTEEFLSRLFDWGDRQIRNFGWYGMIDFGDTLSWYRKEAYDKSYDEWGWHPEGRWGWFNCEEVGTHSGALIQFLRTADYKYFKFGVNLSRHIMDIDTCHYNSVANDKQLRNRIPDDYSQVGSMHRHNGNHWGGRNEETSHTNVFGLVLYYYITGDARAKDVIDEVGSFLLKDRVTYFRHPDVAPQRSIANVLWSDVVLYELTGDERYKKAADKWANLFYVGQKSNGAWPENYNPIKNRWDGKPALAFMTGYTLPALIAYHQLTGNKAIAECIIKATDFIIKNEEYGAYFDASAYSYWLTGNRKYRDNIAARLDFSIGHQRSSDDLIWDGMIYQKAIYGRVLQYLYHMPFALEVLTDGE